MERSQILILFDVTNRNKDGGAPGVTSIVCPKKKSLNVGRKQNFNLKFICLFWTNY